MMFNKYFHQYEIGETWVSKGRTITEADLVMFSAFSGDWFPLHTDKEYAANTQFKQRIAHGMLILSAATGLFQFEPGIVVAFYGLEKVRFTNPTFIGDTIHVELKVIDLFEKGYQGVVTVIQEIKKQNGETVVIANMKIMVNSDANVKI
ncbi:MaoC/PaaZ C-terminal domain-containing protein [Peribacillus simplex]|uniref:MaoC/PaaZ C-terminal domain-containing protein n=3 Tax=Bacillaceae TaxID=186817 RepID=A0AA90P948_9BACI|nr:MULTISPECIES: MaoC/PaaZ C-terminal domain-containing protein [Peribacillus]MDP1421963.1 MaoC/PaaZ C-terminal domain-containing protein [Peribacillus simplex]MDP1454651.1 MaoC/PaaZ C-terminal domain-containing protein [Peribacillus frigoritolerans]